MGMGPLLQGHTLVPDLPEDHRFSLLVDISSYLRHCRLIGCI